MWKLLSETGLPTRGGLTGNKEVERVSVNYRNFVNPRGS